MEWLTENWFWVLIGVFFVGMHLFGHGGHGGGGGCGHGGHGSSDKAGTDKPSGHQH
jgi:hypothetical protein